MSNVSLASDYGDIDSENDIWILLSSGNWGQTLSQKSPFDASISFGSKFGSECVLVLSTEWDEQKGFVVNIRPWYPYACQGGGSCANYAFSCMAAVREPEEIFFWIRNNNKHNYVNIDSDSYIKSYNKAKIKKMKTRRASVSKWLKTPAGMEKSLSILYDVILNAHPTVPSQLEIGSLEHDLASKVLLEKLLATKMKRLEFCDFEDESKKQRVLGLCCGLLQHSTSLEELYCSNFISFDHELGEKLFKSIIPPILPPLASSTDELKGNHHQTSFKKLELPNGRYNATWHKGGKKRRPDDEITIPLSTLESLLVPLADQRIDVHDGDGVGAARKVKPSFNSLDLGGNTPSNDAMMALATALPKLGLETLKLRDTQLQEDALLQFAKSLQQDKTLKNLDLSSNTISLDVLKELCLALESNETLECLFLEHCDLELEHAEYLAEHLPQFVGLRHLYLDGNTFTWEPLRKDELVSVGASCLVHALENNRILLTLRLGEFGRVLPCGLVCCTTPSYQALLDKTDSQNLDGWLERNKKIHEEVKKSKAQENIVNVAKILLDKMS